LKLFTPTSELFTPTSELGTPILDVENKQKTLHRVLLYTFFAVEQCQTAGACS
jgi:hypothetical protein